MQSHLLLQNPIICPASTSDGRDVIIRLVRIENDPSPSGARHLSILRRIGKGHVACIGSNHIVPVLQELTDVERGLTFVVQPKLWDIGAFPKWYTAREAADFVVQIFEVSVVMVLPERACKPVDILDSLAIGLRLLPQTSHCASRKQLIRFRRIVRTPG